MQQSYSPDQFCKYRIYTVSGVLTTRSNDALALYSLIIELKFLSNVESFEHVQSEMFYNETEHQKTQLLCKDKPISSK